MRLRWWTCHRCAYRLPRLRTADPGGKDGIQGRGHVPETRRPGMGRIPGPVLHVAAYVPCSEGNPAASEGQRSVQERKDTSHVCRGVEGDARAGEVYNPWRCKKSCKGVPLARLMVHPRHSMHSTCPRGCLSKYIQPIFARVISCLQQVQTGGSAWYRLSPFGVSV